MSDSKITLHTVYLYIIWYDLGFKLSFEWCLISFLFLLWLMKYLGSKANYSFWDHAKATG
jgi:hypothetical protein